MDYKKVIGQRIREARERKVWTLAELSRRTGDVLTLQRIGAYEIGERMPGPAEAVILAKALGVRPAYIMAVDDVQLQISLQEESLVKNWRKLPENERMSYFRKIEQTSIAFRDTLSDTQGDRQRGSIPKTARAKSTRSR